MQALCAYTNHQESIMIKIRNAEDSDYPEIFSIMKENMFSLQSGIGIEWNDERIQSHYRRKANLVVIDKGILTGFAFYELFEKEIFIHTLQVLREKQNSIIGYRLFRKLIQEASCNNLRFVRCCVFENNKAKEMYYRIGFKELSRENSILKLELDLKKIDKRLLKKLRT